MDFATIVTLKDSSYLKTEEQRKENFCIGKDTLFVCENTILDRWYWLYLNNASESIFQFPESLREGMKIAPDNSGVWSRRRWFI